MTFWMELLDFLGSLGWSIPATGDHQHQPERMKRESSALCFCSGLPIFHGLSPSDLYIPGSIPPCKGIPLFVLCYTFDEDPPYLLRAACAAWQRGDTSCAFPSTLPGPFLGFCHGPEGKGTVCSASTGARLLAASTGSRRRGVTSSQGL